jgi:hypothetical protein
MMTKKLTRIEPHSSLRKLVMVASTGWPAMSKRSLSPSFQLQGLGDALFHRGFAGAPGAS